LTHTVGLQRTVKSKENFLETGNPAPLCTPVTTLTADNHEFHQSTRHNIINKRFLHYGTTDDCCNMINNKLYSITNRA